MSLFSELKRRNVFRVGVAYVVVGWLLMQVAEIMVPALHLPDLVLTATVYFLAIGFIPALILAWAFEMTPEGLKRESEVDRNEYIAPRTGRKLDFTIIAVLVVAVLLLVADKFRGDSEPATGPVDNDTAVAEAGKGRHGIAVLPFENLSSNKENEYFAAGVHEDILTYLSRISDLRVNSRTSVEQYANTQLNLKQVAEELGADFIVEGSVRRAGNRVRVSAQLIDAKTDENLWAESFDRELTDVFEIQTTVAQKIVASLQATLRPVADQMMEAPPTENIQAYDLFLKARAAMRSADYANFYSPEAAEFLMQAVEIDPGYAEAWAMLAISHGTNYWFGNERTPERLLAMKDAVDKAYELKPDLPEAELALATYFYRGHYDYENALIHLENAKKLIPYDADLWFNLGLTLRRLGRYQESVAAFAEAVRLDTAHNEAWSEYYMTAANIYDYDAATTALELMPVRYRNSAKMVGSEALVAIWNEGDLEKAKRILSKVVESRSYWFNFARWNFVFFARDYEQAAELALHPNFSDQHSPGSGHPDAAIALLAAGYDERADHILEEGERIIQGELSKPQTANYIWPHIALARTLVLKGENTEALQSCATVEEILSIERDAIDGVDGLFLCAWVVAMTGDLERGLDMLEQAMESSYSYSPVYLQMDPSWDFLRGTPRFEALANRPFEWGPE